MAASKVLPQFLSRKENGKGGMTFVIPPLLHQYNTAARILQQINAWKIGTWPGRLFVRISFFLSSADRG